MLRARSCPVIVRCNNAAVGQYVLGYVRVLVLPTQCCGALGSDAEIRPCGSMSGKLADGAIYLAGTPALARRSTDTGSPSASFDQAARSSGVPGVVHSHPGPSLVLAVGHGCPPCCRHARIHRVPNPGRALRQPAPMKMPTSRPPIHRNILCSPCKPHQLSK